MENRHNKIVEFIRTIRESFGGSIAVYTMGNCYQFFEILKQVYPDAEAFYDGNHVWTKIDDKYYDIRGEANTTFHIKRSLDRKYRIIEKNFKRRLIPVTDPDLIASLSKNKWSDQRRKNYMKDIDMDELPAGEIPISSAAITNPDLKE